MKRMICITIGFLFAVNLIQAKQLPDFVQQQLDSLQKETLRSLTDYRIWDYRSDKGMTLPLGLGFFSRGSLFSYDETLLIDSLGLNLSVGMIYNDEMRDRIVQLMRNEYQEWELDTLVNRQISQNLRYYERQTMEICKIDTFPIFRIAINNLYDSLEVQNTLDMFKKLNKIYDYEVFKSLQLDTATFFKQAYNKMLEREREREREYYLTNPYYDYTYLAELCGYIGDKRFIKPLIEMLGKPLEDHQKNRVLEALVRLRVEPYYSDYIKERTLTREQIMDEKKRLNFSFDDFVYVLRTQEAFLELSKYLLSNKPYQLSIADDYVDITPVSQYAFYLMRNNIENEDIQKIIGPYREDFEVLLKPLYDWMQENYGKYKIRRIW